MSSLITLSAYAILMAIIALLGWMFLDLAIKANLPWVLTATLLLGVGTLEAALGYAAILEARERWN
jgi:uncharacterized membrane protein